MANVTAEDINAETNARFWAQTNYKPGKRLDMAIPADKAMSSVWKDINQQVKAAAARGILRLTYKQPNVAAHLANAEQAAEIAETHVEAATDAPSAPEAAGHLAAAQTAADVSASSADRAAAAQPPTVSPELAQAAAKKVAATPPAGGAADRVARAQAKAAPAKAADVHAAARGDWTITNYGNAADVMHAMSNAMASVVALDKNGKNPSVQTFASSEAASAAYDKLVNAPGDRWYLALYDASKTRAPNARVDETYLGGVGVVSSVKRPIAAIVATATAAGLAVFAGRKRKHSKGGRS